jgi:hypothetical protein
MERTHIDEHEGRVLVIAGRAQSNLRAERPKAARSVRHVRSVTIRRGVPEDHLVEEVVDEVHLRCCIPFGSVHGAVKQVGVDDVEGRFPNVRELCPVATSAILDETLE